MAAASHIPSYRHRLAGLLAGAVLLAVASDPLSAQAITPPDPPCNQISGGGTTVSCSGNLLPGVRLENGTGPYTTLDIRNLSGDIAPLSGAEGVHFGSHGPVTLDVDTGGWKIVTTGAGANGIVGGSLGSGSVDISVSGSLQTNGTNANGILGESIDGDLSVRSFAAIETTGLASSGIRANSFTGAIDVFSSGSISTWLDSSHGIEAASDGPIGISSLGSIVTRGDDAAGIFAESAGGPIGIEAAGSIDTWGENADGIFAEAGDLAVIFSEAAIHTHGQSAFGIFADGEHGALVYSMGEITTSEDFAAGIAVTSAQGDAAVVSLGNITTTGAAADGISVYSATGTALALSAGVISATGIGSAGIYANGQNATVVNLGWVTGGPCCGAVDLVASDTAVVQNFGTIIGDDAGYAIGAMASDILVDNYGTVTGVVLLDGGSSVFDNHAGALFNSGLIVTADTVINDGTIAPGGRGVAQTTNLGGDFEQGATGIYAVDLDPAATSDRNDIIVVSNTATVAGTVNVSLLSLPLTPTQTFTILSASGGLTDNGLALVASPALHATLFDDANKVYLGIAVDYVSDGLNARQRAIAASLQQIFAGGGGGLEPTLLGLLNVGGLGQYMSALDQLSPQIYSDAEIGALYSSLAFSNSLMSCKVNGTDTASIIREGQCLWAGASARFLNTSTTGEQAGFNETAGLFSAGAQVALDDVWRLGVAGGYQSSTLDTASGATSKGDLGQAGIVLKYNPGALLLAGAVSGGGGHYDTRRPMSFGGFSAVAEGGQDLGIFSGSARAAYVLGSPHLYAKPILDASVTQLELGSFTESGGGGAALAVASASNTVLTVAPSVEVGTEWWLANGTLLRPMLRLGGVFYSGNDLALTAGFAGLGPLNAVPGGPSFTLTTETDDAMGLVGAGLDVINGNDAVLRLSYDGQIGETTQIHAVGLKGSARF